MVKTRRDKRRKRTKDDLLRPGEQYSRGFHPAETCTQRVRGVALTPECVTNLFTSSQSERTRFEVDPILSQCVRIATGEPVLPFLYKEGWLEQYRAIRGRSVRSSRRGHVLPGSMERHAQGKGTQVLFFKSFCQTEVLNLHE